MSDRRRRSRSRSRSRDRDRRSRSRSYSSSDDDRDKGVGDKVAKHYNQLEEAGLDARSQSRIFYLRNFNNWIKSACIADIVQKIRDRRGDDCKISVLDMACGKGGDILKWRIAHIDRLVCADIAATSVIQCERRYQDNLERARRARQRMFRCQFITADCSKALLKERYKDPDQMFHITSCQFALHYAFESYQQADTMLRNLCERLKPGGYFIGTTPDSYEVVRRLKEVDGLSYGNDLYKVTFKNKEEFPLFGCQYHFSLHGVVDCPEFLVYFPLLVKMAEKYKMKLVYKKTFAQFFKDMVKDKENEELLSRMQALEQYPPDRETDLVSTDSKDYKHAKKFLEDAKKKAKEERSKRSRRDSDSYSDSYSDSSDDERYRRSPKIGTLTKAEWEANSMYVIFAFQKEKEKSEKEKDKEREKEKEKERKKEKEREKEKERARDRESSKSPTKKTSKRKQSPLRDSSRSRSRSPYHSSDDEPSHKVKKSDKDKK
ncbi:mRNA cap guanine-N(7) methyltransferase-like [Glandiceps talaboti]